MLNRQCIICASWGQHQHIIRAILTHHQRIISASPVHHWRIIRASSVHHQRILCASSAHHWRNISASSVHHQCVSSVPRGPLRVLHSLLCQVQFDFQKLHGESWKAHNASFLVQRLAGRINGDKSDVFHRYSAKTTFRIYLS